MRRFFLFIISLFVIIVCANAEPKDGINSLKLNEKTTAMTATGIKLPTGFGSPEEFYAVFRVSGLQAGVKYQATIAYDGGTDIYYGMSWLDGNPLLPDWNSFGGIGSGTGSGKVMPGYEQTHLFTTDPKSTKGVIYLVVRSGKPWTISMTVTVTAAKAGIDRNTKNNYDYYAVEDWTKENTVLFLLTKD
jgi:hypothetical protein